MTTPQPGPGEQPDWSPIDSQSYIGQDKLDQFTQDYAAVAGKMPKTAAEALDQAHQAYIGATATTKAAQRYTFQFRKRRKLLDLANIAFSSAQWLMQEEQRLRLAEQSPVETGGSGTGSAVTQEQVEAYRACVLTLKQWRAKIEAHFKQTNRPDLRWTLVSEMKGRERDAETRSEMREAHDAVVTALSNVELVGTARAVQIGRELYDTLYRSCAILLSEREPEMPLRERREILQSFDPAPLIAEIRDDFGNDVLADGHGESAAFAG